MQLKMNGCPEYKQNLTPTFWYLKMENDKTPITLVSKWDILTNKN